MNSNAICEIFRKLTIGLIFILTVSLLSCAGGGRGNQKFGLGNKSYETAATKHNLGIKYYNGVGGAKDIKKAAKLFREAAELGLKESQSMLGHMYSMGKGVPVDAIESTKWYRKAAEQGDAFSQGKLGLAYYIGYGVPKNSEEAKKWFRLSAKGGDQGSKDALAGIEKMETVLPDGLDTTNLKKLPNDQEAKSQYSFRPDKSVQKLLARGIKENRNGKLEASIQTLTKAISLSPNHFSAYGLRATVFHAKGDLDRAMQDYNQSIKLISNAKFKSTEDANTVMEPLYLGRGEIHYIKGNLENSIQDFNQVLKIDPNDLESYQLRGKAHLDRGKEFMISNDFQKANKELDSSIQDYEKFIELNPNPPSAIYKFLGLAYLSKHEASASPGIKIMKKFVKLALRDLNKALQIDPNDPETYLLRGQAYKRLHKKGDAALYDFKRCVELSPNNAECNVELGIAYQFSRTKEMNLQKACVALDRGCQLDQKICEMVQDIKKTNSQC